jgi:hypothetical protein
MKPKRLLSMRDIPTIQGLKNRAVSGNREQMISEFARLEHEKARLERELNIWLANQKKTEDRLHHVQERLNLLQNLLDGVSGPTHRRLSQGLEEEAEEQNSGYQEISIEY